MKKLTLVFDDVPDRAFIPVVRKRDILKAKILTHSEKAKLPHGSSDVHVESPLGHERLMSRNEVISKYCYLNGHRIKMAGWKSGKEYIIMCNDSTNAVAMMIPINCIMQLGGKVVNAKNKDYGEYVVCMQDQQGNIDRSTASVINRSMFRKMFSIIPNEVIERHRGSGNKSFNTTSSNMTIGNKFSSLFGAKNTGMKQTKVNNKAMGVNNTAIGVNNLKGKLPINPKISNVNSATSVNNIKDSAITSKYTAVGRVLTSENKIVGFVVKDTKGATKQVNKREMLELCSRKLVDNITVATKETNGAKYLRGNGIKIDALAPFYI